MKEITWSDDQSITFSKTKSFQYQIRTETPQLTI